MLPYIVFFCLLNCVIGGLMPDKMFPTSLNMENDGSHISTLKSDIIEHVTDLLGEMSNHLVPQKASGKMGFLGVKLFCSAIVNEKFRICNGKCTQSSMVQRMLCLSKNFVRYLDGCFSDTMECYSDTLVTIGECNSNCNCGTINEPSGKIFGGEDVEYAVKYPWHVGIINTKRGRTAYCGGTIIGDKYVLTAAHCLHTQNIDDTDFSVRIGDHIQTSILDDIRDVTEEISVEKIFFHPLNQKGTFENDLALLKLNQSITFKSDFGIRPVCLPCNINYHYDDSYAGKSAIALGWGKTTNDPNEIPTILKQAEVTILERNCDNKAGNTFNPYQHMCSMSNFMKGFPCTSDNGGSLFVNEGNNTHERYVLVGITQASICNETRPVIYTRVKPALNWIRTLNLRSICLT